MIPQVVFLNFRGFPSLFAEVSSIDRLPGRKAADIQSELGRPRALSLALSLSLSLDFVSSLEVGTPHDDDARGRTRRRPRLQRRRRPAVPQPHPDPERRTRTGGGRQDCLASWQCRFYFIGLPESTPYVLHARAIFKFQSS